MAIGTKTLTRADFKRDIGSLTMYQSSLVILAKGHIRIVYVHRGQPGGRSRSWSQTSLSAASFALLETSLMSRRRYHSKISA